ncbi:MAG TPA: DEAD/DEAH box helicase [Verrucomicrobiae bacterium]
MSFNSLGLSQPVLDAVRALGFEMPTPIQAQSIPIMMQGRDLIGSAQTGTGKTAAFALPILSQLDKPERTPRALVLVPTRELACQVEESIRTFARFSHLRCTVLYGGVGYGKQFESLRCGTDIVVATPGRLLDHLERRTLDLRRIKHLVLDEADRMLDMGFLPDVKRIISQVPQVRQTALFSATIPAQIESLIKWAMKSPETVEIGQRRSPAETVRHSVYPVADSQKSDLLQKLLEHSEYRSAIVFCRTKHRADRIAKMLSKHNHAVAVIHSNRSQRERDQALGGFRDGRFKVLVATDIAARGIDVADVSHVINFDVPHHPEDYVHRIGRTGRAQAEGDAFTLMVAEDAQTVRAIERYIGKPIEKQKVENFEYQYTALFEAPRNNARQSAPVYGKARGGRVHGGYSYGRAKARR